MNYFTLNSLLTLAACTLLLASCASDSSNIHNDRAPEDDMPALIDTAEQDIGQEVIKEVEIPQDEERENNLKKAAAVSPFATLGCCSELKNHGSDCCCDEVVERYRVMVEAKDTSIARLKMTDPILSACRKKNRATFDEIDNPEEDYDDMVEVIDRTSKDT